MSNGDTTYTIKQQIQELSLKIAISKNPGMIDICSGEWWT
jgi:hypothetical protein